MDLKFKFDKPFYDDLPPAHKDREELIRLVLLDASGKKCDFSSYNPREISRCARKLILAGFLRGTIISSSQCIWSRITSRGLLYLKSIDV